MTPSSIAERMSRFLIWLTRQEAEIDLEVACAEHPEPARGPRRRQVARLPGCAGDLPDHLWLEVLTCGAARLEVRLDGCGRADATRARLDRLRVLLRAIGQDGRIAVTLEAGRGSGRPVLDMAHPPVSRRQMLLLGVPQTYRPAPPESLSAHERLVEAVRRLCPERTTAPDGLDALPGPGLVLQAPACTGCGMCVRACPTSALTITDLGPRHDPPAAPGVSPPVTSGPGGDESHDVLLAQRPARCDGCRSCIDICPVGTLSATSGWTMSAFYRDEPVPVITVTGRRCARCGAHVPSPTAAAASTSGATRETLCDACGFRRENPFGSSLPPEALDRLPADVLRRLGHPTPG